MTIPRFWRQIDERYNLKGRECGNCGHVMFPPRSLCPKCRHASVGKLAPYDFKGEGVIETFTTVHQSTPGHDAMTPYVIGIVKLDEGPRVTTQIADVKSEDVQVGMRVRQVFRRINQEGEGGVIHYGYKFVPAPDR